MSIQDDNMDLLQNIERAVVGVWKQHAEMTDHVAARAYEAAFQCYRTEARGHPAKPSTLTGLDAEVFASIRSVCEERLGRGPEKVASGDKTRPIPVTTMADCLRELQKSVIRHTKQGGSHGYLNFVDQYLK